MSDGLDQFVSDFSRVYILTILYEGPAHGYGIVKRFRRRVGKDVSPSLVYPFLRLLRQRGLVTYRGGRVGDRRRKVYALTDKGEALCQRLFERFTTLVATAIEPRLDVCANCHCRIYDGGYRKTIDRKIATFCCRHCAESYERERNAEEAVSVIRTGPIPRE